MKPTACPLPPGTPLPPPTFDPPPADGGAAELVLAGGCFWCTEAVFERLAGVRDVTSGYAGGSAGDANYRRVCSGATGHAEAIRVRYEPAEVSLGTLLRVFFGAAHDPTQVDRQGNDRGPQYRSAVFFADERQKEVVERYVDQLNAAGVFERPVATRLEPLERFFEAEAEHQDYARRFPEQPYIAGVSRPKVEKLHAAYPGLVAGAPQAGADR